MTEIYSLQLWLQRAALTAVETGVKSEAATTVASEGETISQFFEISRRRCSCNSVINSTKIRSSCSGRPSISDTVFSDVGNPLDVEIDQVGSSCTVLSVKSKMYCTY